MGSGHYATDDQSLGLTFRPCYQYGHLSPTPQFSQCFVASPQRVNRANILYHSSVLHTRQMPGNLLMVSRFYVGCLLTKTQTCRQTHIVEHTIFLFYFTDMCMNI